MAEYHVKSTCRVNYEWLQPFGTLKAGSPCASTVRPPATLPRPQGLVHKTIAKTRKLLPTPLKKPKKPDTEREDVFASLLNTCADETNDLDCFLFTDLV